MVCHVTACCENGSAVRNAIRNHAIRQTRAQHALRAILPESLLANRLLLNLAAAPAQPRPFRQPRLRLQLHRQLHIPTITRVGFDCLI